MKAALFCFLESMPDGCETLVGVQPQGSMAAYPLVVSDEALVEQMKRAIQTHVEAKGNQVSLVKFESRRVLETFTKGSGKYK